MNKTKSKEVKVNLDYDGVFVIKDGELKTISKPDSGFGEQSVTWQNGKIHAIRVSYTEV